MQVKAGVKNAFRKKSDRAMVKAMVRDVPKMSIELLPKLNGFAIQVTGFVCRRKLPLTSGDFRRQTKPEICM